MTFITAEIGLSWIGDFTTLEFLIQVCKRMGVNAVKFQALNKQLLARHCELPYIGAASINENNVERVNEICKKYEIEWYCTVTDPNQIKFLDKYVNKFKIRRADYQKKNLKTACFNTGKTVIISSHIFQNHDAARIISLLCPKKFPVSYSEINFQMIKRMDGFSNHCPNPLAILRAVEFGAKYIEIHLTPTKDLFLLDNDFAFTPSEFNEIVKWVRALDSLKQHLSKKTYQSLDSSA